MKTTVALLLLTSLLCGAAYAKVQAPKKGDVYQCTTSSDQMNVVENGRFVAKPVDHTKMVDQVAVRKDFIDVTSASALTGVIDTFSFRVVSHSLEGIYAVLVTDAGGLRMDSLVLDVASGVVVFTQTITYSMLGVTVQETFLSECRKLR
jgi:hypothetical protein